MTPGTLTAPGTLSIVGTPIGNHGDITLRAIEVLRTVDIIACEERREGLRLLRRLGIDTGVLNEIELVEVNEHTERKIAGELILELASGKNIALISDCGMPVFADPGHFFVREAIATGLKIDVVPGPTSLGAALAVSGFDAHRFYFYGFLSPKKEERRGELSQLRAFPSTLAFLDAPYRLSQVLADMKTAFGSGRTACVACDLTLPQEVVRRGPLKELLSYFEANKGKREFVILVQGFGGGGKKVRRLGG